MSTKLAKAVARLERCLERWDPKDLLSVVPGDLRTVLDALKEAQARKLCPNRVDARLREKLSTSRTTCAYCEAVHELPCTFDDIRAHVEKCPKHPMAALRAELARLRERDAKVLEKLDETFVTLDGAHQAHCDPVWTGYGRHAPGQHCELIGVVKDALALLKEEP